MKTRYFTSRDGNLNGCRNAVFAAWGESPEEANTYSEDGRRVGCGFWRLETAEQDVRGLHWKELTESDLTPAQVEAVREDSGYEYSMSTKLPRRRKLLLLT